MLLRHHARQLRSVQRALTTAGGLPVAMRAVRVFEPGPAETALNLSDAVEVPEVKPGEVLVRNEFSGVNFHDTYTRSGLYPRDCPFVLGCEGGGTVVAVGPDDGSASDGPSVGDRVTYYCEGSYAEYSAVPAGVAAAVPDELAMGDAVALTVQGLTAHYLTRSTVELTAEHDIIVTAAAGGTGKLVVQMAKMAGARVLGLVSSEHKAAVAMEHGCDETLIYRCPDGGGNVDYSAAAKEFSRTGQGVDVCYDSVGKATAAFSLASLRPRGHCVFYGNASGAPDPIAPLDLAVAGSLYITRPLLNHYVLSREELNWRAAEVFGWAASGALKFEMEQIFPLEQAAGAQLLLTSGTTTGKIMLQL